MGKHAVLAASQTKWWGNCPGAAAYVEVHPELEEPSGFHAQMGTAAHGLVERCIREGHRPGDYLGRLIEIVDPGGEGEGISILPEGARHPKDPTRVVFEVDADMAEATACMTEYVNRRCWELGLCEDADDPAQVAALVGKGTVRLESRGVPLPDRDDTGGTADVTIDAWPELIETIDYKNGSGVFVSVVGNEQLRSYSLGSLYDDGWQDYRKVIYPICQPRHPDSPPDGIMSEETTTAELIEWRDDWLEPAAEAVDDARLAVKTYTTLGELHETGFLTIGEDGAHCTWCPLKADCPAWFAKAQKLAGADFKEEEAGDMNIPTGSSELSAIIPWVPFLDKWLKAVKARGEHILLQGGTVEGQKLVRGRSTRSWDDEMNEDDIVSTMEEDYGVDPDDMYKAAEQTLITGPQAEKLVERASRGAFNEALLVKPEGKLTMVPEDDQREAVEVEPGGDFDDGLGE